MTAFALRMSRYCNGVEQKARRSSAWMWRSLWPGTKDEDIPISSITNGIHVPTWIEPKMDLLFDKHLGPDWLEDHDNPAIWELAYDIPDQDLWQTHYWHKIKLINFIRDRARLRWAEDHVSPTNIVAGGTLLAPMALTIGFARRFATYKRADLIFRDLDRLKALLNNRWRPVQIVLAGKAHPADDPGKSLLQKVFKFACNPEMGGRIAFVENYDEQLAQYIDSRGRRLAQQSITAYGGKRDERDESIIERCPESEHPRRVVARRLQRQKRMGLWTGKSCWPNGG